ncbi:nickel-dependent hydrogenase large subunit [Desulfobacterales bacterium HSG17]|nr:nickel-dependent hydrogenase large subunit [Desulfobacterales bacterium HSG17]
MSKKYIFPINRVEGDLEIQVELTDGVISEAWSVGTMYRGFENIMKGRSPMDSLVITPRVCGICSTAHLKAAAKALDMAYNAIIPDTAKMIRNVTMGVEMLQNDVRQGILLFMCDFANPYYNKSPLFTEAKKRYEPLKGSSTLQALTETASIIEIIAILGGQWPHSSFMVPGGVVSAPGISDINQCIYLLSKYQKWYEKQILGCTIERWAKVKNRSDLDKWLYESPLHANNDLGFFIRFSKDAGLENIGKGCGNFISFGSFDIPENTDVKSIDKGPRYLPSGFSQGTKVQAFSQKKISEDSNCSWFRTDEKPLHPFEGRTIPYATGGEGEKYSWAKAPRYDGLPAETGPLAQMIIAKNPLFTDLVSTNGPDAFSRELARIVRPAIILPVLEQWIKEIARDRENFCRNYHEAESGKGFGLIDAPRGALGHWIHFKNNKIENYQIITPSAWNGSPRDTNSIRGPWEQALVGTSIKDIDNPIEAAHIIRSFDPCLVCTVHAI